MGLSQEWVQNKLVKVRQDDDVSTDEEIMDSALKACSRDYNDTRQMIASIPPKQLINNFDFSKRVSHPDLFDRNGKFCVKKAAEANN